MSTLPVSRFPDINEAPCGAEVNLSSVTFVIVTLNHSVILADDNYRDCCVCIDFICKPRMHMVNVLPAATPATTVLAGG